MIISTIQMLKHSTLSLVLLSFFALIQSSQINLESVRQLAFGLELKMARVEDVV